MTWDLQRRKPVGLAKMEQLCGRGVDKAGVTNCDDLKGSPARPVCGQFSWLLCVTPSSWLWRRLLWNEGLQKEEGGLPSVMACSGGMGSDFCDWHWVGEKEH